MAWGFLICYLRGLEGIGLKAVPAVTVGCIFLSVNSLTFVIPFGAYYVRAGIILEMCWGEELHFCALCIVLSLPLCICWCLPWKKLLLFQCFVSGVWIQLLMSDLFVCFSVLFFLKGKMTTCNWRDISTLKGCFVWYLCCDQLRIVVFACELCPCSDLWKSVLYLEAWKVQLG